MMTLTDVCTTVIGNIGHRLISRAALTGMVYDNSAPRLTADAKFGGETSKESDVWLDNASLAIIICHHLLSW